MRRWGLLLTVVLLVLLAPPVQAQQATPTATPAYWAWETDSVGRYWEGPGLSEAPDEISSLRTDATSFDTPEHVGAALPMIATDQFRDRPDLGWTFKRVERIAAPSVGDESQVRSGLMAYGADHPHADRLVLLLFRSGNVMVELLAWTFLVDVRPVDVGSVATVLVGIGQSIQGRQPSDVPPHKEGGITVGGLWDVLPGYEDVPVGFTLSWELPDVTAGAVATPTA
jgi:hypothetical protein